MLALSQYIETWPLGVLVDSVEKDLVYTENNGIRDVYDVRRIADSNYAAKELCGPFAYNREDPPLGPISTRKGSQSDHEDLSQSYDDGRAAG